MKTPKQSPNARLAAILALAIGFIVVLVVIISSLNGGTSGPPAGPTDRGVQRNAKQSQRKVYVVKPGDCCLSEIGRKTGVGVDQLERLNPQLDPQAIHSGDRVKLR